jgi:hypothetical protein
MNLDSNIVQKTMQSLLTDVAPNVLTPDISNVASITGDDGPGPDGHRIRSRRQRRNTRKSKVSHSTFNIHHKTSKKKNKTNKIKIMSLPPHSASSEHHHDPIIALYEQMNAANVELNHQNNAGCFKFQESAIDIQSQVPRPETFSDKFISREMRECIKNDSKKILTFECRINQRDIRLFFVLFKNHIRCKEDVASYYKTHARRVFMWLHMISLKSSCVESLDIYIYLTPFKKRLPENKSEVIGPVNANTGYTYRCEKKNEIVIYRQEEWFKVLLHETMHAFGNDFDKEDDDNSMMVLRKIFSLPQEIRIQMSETYSEIWARIMNVAFQTYFKNLPSLESITAKQFKKNFEFYLNLESVFSLYQCIKILDFMGVNYQILIDDSDHSKKMMRSFYRENTHVFAYYVLTSILLHSYGDFLSWCMKKNGHGLDMFKVKATQHNFAELIASCYKKHDLLQKIVETETKVVRDYQKSIAVNENEDDDEQLVTTLRMTIVGFD